MQTRRVELDSAEILLLPRQLRALRRALMDFHGLATQLFAYGQWLLVTQCRKAGVEGFVQTTQAIERLSPLRRVQVTTGQQGFDLRLVTATQGFLNLLVAFDLQAMATCPRQPIILLGFRIGGIEARQQAFEPHLQHRRRTVLPPQQLVLRLFRRITAGHQAQPYSVTLRRGLYVLTFRAAQQLQAQSLGCILITGAFQCVGIGRPHQPVLRTAFEVHAIPGECFCVAAQQLAGTGERQPQQSVLACIIAPLGHQRLEFRGVRLVNVEPHQSLAEQVVSGVTRQAQLIQAFGLIGIPLLGRQCTPHRQHLSLIKGIRILLGIFKQRYHSRPVVQLLSLLQRFDQALRIPGALPAANRQRQGALRIASAIHGDQLALVATGQLAIDRKQFFQRNP
ncbi:hypothetical protein D3C87_914050 [compost metagenome]